MIGLLHVLRGLLREVFQSSRDVLIDALVNLVFEPSLLPCDRIAP